MVALNVSDHLTRARWIEGDKEIRVIGALLGKQEGKVIEIVNTFEISFKSGENGTVLINEDFAKMRLDAYKQMFGDLQCIGWYSAQMNSPSDRPQDIDLIPHKTLSKFTENPIMLHMNAMSADAL